MTPPKDWTIEQSKTERQQTMPTAIEPMSDEWLVGNNVVKGQTITLDGAAVPVMLLLMDTDPNKLTYVPPDKRNEVFIYASRPDVQLSSVATSIKRSEFKGKSNDERLALVLERTTEAFAVNQ